MISHTLGSILAYIDRKHGKIIAKIIFNIIDTRVDMTLIMIMHVDPSNILANSISVARHIMSDIKTK